MRRVTKKYLAVAQTLAFTLLLCLVLYFNLGPSTATDRTFDWKHVRYRSGANKIPEARGVCPGLSSSKGPALVVARVAEDGDSRWLQNLADRFHLCVYTIDMTPDTSSRYLQVPANRGHEAMAYLTFLIDNYDSIPEAGVVFIHGSRWAWHNDDPTWDNAALLSTLNTSSALQPHGYHNLRCDWAASTCHVKEAPPQGSLETAFKSKLQPWDARAVSDAALPKALGTLFGGGAVEGISQMLLGRADAVRSQCCAQFVVSQANIWKHSQHEYIALRQWLLDGSAAGAPADDRVAGRILSYIWHILFLAPEDDSHTSLDRLNAQACPSASECYCRLYGKCDLPGCTYGRCQGMYAVPPGFRLPAGWEAAHTDMV